MLRKNNGMKQNKILSMKNMMNKSKFSFNKLNRNNRNNTNNINNPTLKEGDVGNNVDYLQKMLIEIATTHATLPVVTRDAIFGSVTKSAVIGFQKISGIEETGIVNNLTWNKLAIEYNRGDKQISNDLNNKTEVEIREMDEKNYLNLSSNIIKEGSKGNYVIQLQRYLNKIADEYITIPKLVVDGIFGPKTKASVVEFQNLFGITPNGIVTDDTWEAIKKVL